MLRLGLGGAQRLVVVVVAATVLALGLAGLAATAVVAEAEVPEDDAAAGN